MQGQSNNELNELNEISAIYAIRMILDKNLVSNSLAVSIIQQVRVYKNIVYRIYNPVVIK